MNFECVPHVCYDTGNAVLEYGHRPRPQILHVVKKKHGSKPRNMCIRKKKLCSRCVLALVSMAQVQGDRTYLMGTHVPEGIAA